MSISTTINNTLGSVASSYPTYVNSVVEALTEREYDLSDQIVQQVTSNFDVDAGIVKGRLATIGMAVRPEPEPEQPVSEEDRVANVEKGLADLTEVVQRLVRLAEQHLGA